MASPLLAKPAARWRSFWTRATRSRAPTLWAELHTAVHSRTTIETIARFTDVLIEHSLLLEQQSLCQKDRYRPKIIFSLENKRVVRATNTMAKPAADTAPSIMYSGEGSLPPMMSVDSAYCPRIGIGAIQGRSLNG